MPVLGVTVLACFALLPEAQAISPLPDGGYADQNTAEGFEALFTFTGTSPNDGGQNTALGFKALFHNANGRQNTATGFGALFSNTAGFFNAANGFQALFRNTMGSVNTATGAQALFTNTMGSDNTATGSEALFNNTIGKDNTATGAGALSKNTNGVGNTAIGFEALKNNTGSDNIAVGGDAGFNLTTGGGNIDIGNQGVAGESNTIRIGDPQTDTAAFIGGIAGVTITTNNAPVAINTMTGQLGMMPVASSRRFKDEIKPMDKTSEAILALKPVTFHYKKDIDPNRTAQFGLVAEEVEKVNPDLITRDRDGKPYTVRYEAVNAMLLNEFLKEHRKVEQQRKNFEAALAQQQKQIEVLTAGLQKVSAQLEASRPVTRVAENNQ